MADITVVPPVEVPAPVPPHHKRWRRITATTLVVLSCIFAATSVLAIWVRNQVLNTDRYVANVAPLASNPQVINTVATTITTELFANIDVENHSRRVAVTRPVPRVTDCDRATDAGTRGGATSAGVETVPDALDRSEPPCQAQTPKALTGGGPVLSTKNGKVVLDLTPIVEQVRLSLKARGVGIFDHIPIDHLALRFELFDAGGLSANGGPAR